MTLLSFLVELTSPDGAVRHISVKEAKGSCYPQCFAEFPMLLIDWPMHPVAETVLFVGQIETRLRVEGLWVGSG